MHMYNSSYDAKVSPASSVQAKCDAQARDRVSHRPHDSRNGASGLTSRCDASLVIKAMRFRAKVEHVSTFHSM